MCADATLYFNWNESILSSVPYVSIYFFWPLFIFLASCLTHTNAFDTYTRPLYSFTPSNKKAPPGAEIQLAPNRSPLSILLNVWLDDPLRSWHVRELHGEPYLPVWGSYSVFSSFQTNSAGILQGQEAKDKSYGDCRWLRIGRFSERR